MLLLRPSGGSRCRQTQPPLTTLAMLLVDLAALQLQPCCSVLPPPLLLPPPPPRCPTRRSSHACSGARQQQQQPAAAAAGSRPRAKPAAPPAEPARPAQPADLAQRKNVELFSYAAAGNAAAGAVGSTGSFGDSTPGAIGSTGSFGGGASSAASSVLPLARPLKAKPEVLAPAGGWPQLRAAVENGADAVYFGVADGFNARAR